MLILHKNGDCKRGPFGFILLHIPSWDFVLTFLIMVLQST